jgi:hypothetical protein
MLFFFKPKNINLDCFTPLRSNITMFPIDYSSRFFPEWWRQLPKEFEHTAVPAGLDPKLAPTMKSCVGFTRYFNQGVTMPLWSDLRIDITTDPLQYHWDMVDGDGHESQVHDFRQMGTYLDPHQYGQLKITPKWIFSCQEDVNWVWTQNTWCAKSFDIILPPGILNFRYAGGVAVNMFFSLAKQQTFKLDAGQPLVNIIPMSERPVKIHLHEVSNEEYSKIISRDRAFTYGRNKYKKNREFLQKNESRCPFGFGNK